MEATETKVPVPWGHISVKIWGDQKNPAVLVVHGVLDNAGAFDRLLALLPDCFCYYCMDLPGHGQSSHWPSSAVIHTLDNLLAYRAVTDHFKREKYFFIGHSWGAQCGIMFAQLYPERIKKIVMLDAIYTFPVPTSQFAQYLRTSHDNYFEMMEKLMKKKAPEYSYEEMLDKLMTQRRYGSINQAAAEALMQRNVKKTENGNFRFASDPRLKHFVNPTFDMRYITELFKNEPVRCPVLIVIASESIMLLEYFKTVSALIKRWKNFKVVHVEGNHDVHNSYPERVAPPIAKFLVKELRNKL